MKHRKAGRPSYETVAKIAQRLQSPNLCPTDLVSPNQAGKLLGISGEAVKQWIYGKKVSAQKTKGGYWKIKIGDLIRYMDGRASIRDGTAYEPMRRGPVVMATANETVAERMGAQFVSRGLSSYQSPRLYDTLLKINRVQPSGLIVDLESYEDAWELLRRLRGMANMANVPVVIFSRKMSEDDFQLAVTHRVLGYAESAEEAAMQLAAEVARTSAYLRDLEGHA